MASFTAILISCAALTACTTALFPHKNDQCRVEKSEYTYEGTGMLAGMVTQLTSMHIKEFMKFHELSMIHSPTAKAVGEFFGKINYAKNFAGEECLANGEEALLKDYRKRQAEVVFDCEMGWELSTELSTKAQALLTTLQDLDKQVKEQLKNCKPDLLGCYFQFKRSALGVSIDKQLTELRQNELVDIQLLADKSSIEAFEKLARCNADNSDELRKDIYTSIAKINICTAKIGLLPEF